MATQFLLWLIPTLFSVGNGQMQCETYACAYPPLLPEVCIQRTNTAYSLYPCPADLPYCPTDFYGARSACTKPPSPQVISYIGDPCSQNVSCVEGNCRNSTCVGAAYLETCENNSDCGLGLRCDESKRCLHLLSDGSWLCTQDQDCELTSGCVGLGGTKNGTCVPYFSIDSGGRVTACINNRSNLCKSGFCIEQGEDFPLYFCIDAPKSLLQIPTECRNNKECMGISRPWTFSGTCECGYNAQGLAYCQLFDGDPGSEQLREVLKNITVKMRPAVCNTARRWQDDCLQKGDSSLFQTFSVLRAYVSLYPQLQGNDLCVKQILTPAYWAYAGTKVLIFIGFLLFNSLV